MAHEFSLEDVTQTAYQATLVCALLENYPSTLEDFEVIAIAGLLKKMTDQVATWLAEERKRQEVEQ